MEYSEGTTVSWERIGVPGGYYQEDGSGHV
jgi:hypothetical protein